MSAGLLSSGRHLVDVPLRCVTYVSENRIAGSEAHWAAEVEDILLRSRRWNRSVGVTGILLLTERHFVQVLEGASPLIVLTLDRIRRDSRHRILHLQDRAIESRRFDGWSMAYLSHRDGKPALLSPTADFAMGEDADPVLLMMQYLLAAEPWG